MGYKMKGFSGFGNSPAKQQDALEKKLVSQEFDTDKSENKLDGNKASTQDDIIKFPDKDKTSPALQLKNPKRRRYEKEIKSHPGHSEKIGPVRSPKTIKTKEKEFSKTNREMSNTYIGSAENKALSEKSWKQSRELNEIDKYKKRKK